MANLGQSLTAREGGMRDGISSPNLFFAAAGLILLLVVWK